MPWPPELRGPVTPRRPELFDRQNPDRQDVPSGPELVAASPGNPQPDDQNYATELRRTDQSITVAKSDCCHSYAFQYIVLKGAQA